MTITDRITSVITEYPSSKKNQDELLQLQEFFRQMKEAGIAVSQEYNLPPPDTLGRVLVERHRILNQVPSDRTPE